jgi:type I restriction enzyme, S subunit
MIKFISLGQLDMAFEKGINPIKSNEGDSILIPSGAIFANGINFNKTHKVLVTRNDFDKILKQRDILFNTGGEGTIGRSSFFDYQIERCFSDGFVLVIRNNDKNVDSKFLFYCLNTFDVQNQIYRLKDGTTGITSIKTSNIKKINIPSFEITEQIQIATIISKVDEAISQTEQLIAKYTRIKTGIMQDLLTKGIDEHGNIRSEATHEFKDSPLGRIPKEWNASPLNQLCELIVDCKNRTCPFVEKSDFPVIRTSNIKEGKLIWEDMKYTDLKSYKIWTERAIPSENDVIITREAPLGQVLKIPIGISPVLGQRTMLFRLDSSKLLPDFLVNAILTEKMQLYLHSLSGGSTVHHLKVGEVKTILLPHPKSTIEQEKIQEILIKEERAIAELTGNLSKLQLIKTGLMQDLLSGKVRVTHLIKETASL